VYVAIRVKDPSLLSVLIKLEFSQQVLQKYSNINFSDSPPVGAEFFHGEREGQTDGLTERRA
jgi:hypothetical protein